MRMMRQVWLVVLSGVLLVPAEANAQAPTETVEYYALDAIGSVRIVFDANGTILGRMDYGPFGQELGGGTALPHQRFAGLFRDGEAGLDHAQARSYQARTGRFSTVDSLFGGFFEPQAWNRYSYALNSPVNYADATGLQADACNQPARQEGPTRWTLNRCQEDTSGGFWVPDFGPLGVSIFTVPAGTWGRTQRTGREPPDSGGLGVNVEQRATPATQIPTLTAPPKGIPDGGNTPNSGVTIIVGVEATAIGGSGPQVSTGHLWGPSGGCHGVDKASFGSIGGGTGADVSATAFVGAMRGRPGDVAGFSLNINVSVSYIATSLVFNREGRLAGFTIGLTAGPPAAISTTITHTGVIGEEPCR